MGKREVWFGKLYDVKSVVRGEGSCMHCAFEESENCRKVPCTDDERDDEQQVFFVEVADHDCAPCCGNYDTCTTVCVPKEDHFASVINDAPVTYWEDVAAQENRASSYYQSVIDNIGSMLGIDAYTADDGGIHDTVLRAKVPELVARLVYDKALLEAKIRSLEASLRVGFAL